MMGYLRNGKRAACNHGVIGVMDVHVLSREQDSRIIRRRIIRLSINPKTSFDEYIV